MSITHYTVLSTDRGAHSVATSCHCHAHQTGGGSPLSPGPSSFLMPHRREGGGRWTSLHESTSVCPPLLISSQPHPQTLPLTYSALSLCSLHFPNTHTQAQDYYLALPILTSTTTNIIFFLHYPHQQHKITFHFPPGHRHCQNHCTLYNRVRPFPVSGNTLCEYVLPKCMYMYVCMSVRCISV